MVECSIKFYIEKNKMTENKEKIIGVTAGAFDLCHAGHVLMFKEVKKKCDFLIVLL